MANIYSVKVDQENYDKIKNHYSPYIYKENDNYVDYIADKDGVIITGYLSTKKNKTVTFSSLEEAKLWGYEEKEEVSTPKAAPKGWLDIEEQIGSDEVGVGDYLLPMIVVASLVKPSQIKRLHELGVADSKKLTDEKIMEIAPILVKEFKFSKLTLPNAKYNEMYAKNENINSLKAKMHNRALYNLHKEYIDVIRIYVDQFAESKLYYSYLDKEDEPIVTGIGFKTKGESYFPSVALSSVIARYCLILEKERLEAKYGLPFPFGAGKDVDVAAKALKEKVGPEFDQLVKANFKNYKR